MIFRTDLAKEAIETKENKKGIITKKINNFGIEGDFIEILTDDFKDMGKKKGKYISFETDAVISRDVEKYENISRAISEELRKLIENKNGSLLVVGLGNESMTPDSIGPEVVKKILVTRHIFNFLPEEIDPRMSSVCAVAPGVLGVTGIESKDIIDGICKNADIGAIIVIDALAARRSERMFSTFQLTDTGIEPGAGVGNKRSSISKEVLGIPVVAIGVPTVVYASSLIYDAAVNMFSNLTGQNEEQVEGAARQMSAFSGDDMVVTPKEVDIIVKDCAKIIADSINFAFHKNMAPEEIEAYMF